MYMLPIIESPIKADFNNFYYFPQVFSNEEISNLDQLVTQNYKFQKGQVGNIELGILDSTVYNNRNIAYLPPDNNTKGLYEKLEKLVIQANEELFNFSITQVTDLIHYVIYPENGGHLDWHMDVGKLGVNRRKLALTVQLSDPTEYDGGEFEIWFGSKEKFITVPRQKGDVIIFPTFLMHRIKPITRGQRKALVFWTGGEPFR